jgi:hypothetical protein
MIPKQFIEYYGDQTRWFLGTVVNNSDDPLQIGRVRVKIFGIHDEIEDKDLPWAQIVVPTIAGVHSYEENAVGQYLGLLVGTHVFGIFLDGKDSQLPLVLGSLPKKGDDNQRATENYPHNKIYQTKEGHFKEYDDTPENTRIREQHMSGTFTEMEHDGSMRTEVQKDQYIRVLGDATIEVGSDGSGNRANLTIRGDCNITVTGDAKINAKNVSVTGTDTVTVRGGNGVRLG